MKKIAFLLIWFAVPFSASAAESPDPVAPAFSARGAFLAFFVPDVESTVGWYTEKLGLKVVDRPSTPEGVKVAILEGGGLIVELIQHKDAVPRAAPGATGDGFVHGIFKAGVVVIDFDSVLATLKERKIEIAYGPFPASAKQRANVIIRDNHGNLIQLFGQ